MMVGPTPRCSPGSGISQDVSWAGISEALPSWWPGSRGKGNVVLALLIRLGFSLRRAFRRGGGRGWGRCGRFTGSGYPRYVHHLGNTFVALYVHPVGSTFRFGASDVGNGGASYVGSGAFPTWEAGFCFLSLSASQAVLPRLARNGAGSNRTSSQRKYSRFGGSNSPSALARSCCQALSGANEEPSPCRQRPNCLAGAGR